MKNLNVKLAENFNIDFQDVEIEEDLNVSDYEFNKVVSYAEESLTELAKRNIFPEDHDTIKINLPQELIEKKKLDRGLSIDLDYRSAKLVYEFNDYFELERLQIISPFLY